MTSIKRNGRRLSPEARKKIKEYRKLQKKLKSSCVVCGRKPSWWSRFHIHHLFPVKLFPKEQANPATFRWCHAKCHLIVGHGGNWKQYQPEFDNISDQIKNGLDLGKTPF